MQAVLMKQVTSKRRQQKNSRIVNVHYAYVIFYRKILIPRVSGDSVTCTAGADPGGSSGGLD